MKALSVILALFFTSTTTIAQDDPARTLTTNVHVVAGVSNERIENAKVLSEGNLIKAVSTEPMDTGNVTVINGDGRRLMPGIIDNHTHLSTVTISNQISS